MSLHATRHQPFDDAAQAGKQARKRLQAPRREGKLAADAQLWHKVGADIKITKRLSDSLALAEVRVLDHIVVGGLETVSFA